MSDLEKNMNHIKEVVELSQELGRLSKTLGWITSTPAFNGTNGDSTVKLTLQCYLEHPFGKECSTGREELAILKEGLEKRISEIKMKLSSMIVR